MNRVACIVVAFGLASAVVDVLVTNALNDWSINLDLKLQANVAANVNAEIPRNLT